VPRYRTTGIPRAQAALGLSAFLPHFNRLAASGAQMYKGQVSGYPGTQAVATEPATMLPGGSGLNDLSLLGLSRSSDAPSAFWPNLYYVRPEPGFYPGAGMPVQIYDPVRPQDTTMIPVPARDLRALYQKHSAKLAGGIDDSRGRVLSQPAVIKRWLQRRAGNGSGQ
jgi:hypothetical protein